MRLLVVEDDDDLNRQLREALEEAGYVVDSAKDGEEGQYHGGHGVLHLVSVELALARKT